MKKILLLSCGTTACYHFSKIIKTNFKNEFIIIKTDINKKYFIPNFYYIDKFYKVPLSKSTNYYQTILKICKDEKIDFIIPSFDYDQTLFYPENKDLIDLGVISLSTSFDTINDFYKNKKLINSKLKEFGFLIPKIYDLKELKDEKTYMIKPINGVASIGIEMLNKAEILKKEDIENYLIEEYCFEPEITLECFSYKNIFSSVARERVATKSGVCIKTKIYHDDNFENIAKNFASKIKCPNYFNLQFMKNSENEWVITDVNLRLAGGISLSYTAGWDEVSAIANILLEKDFDTITNSLKLNAPIQYVVKAYTDVITKKIEKVIAFDLDGTILNTFDRHIKVMEMALKDFDIALDLTDYRNFKREGNNNIKYLLYKGIKKSLAEEIQKSWIENIEKNQYLKLDYLYPNVVEQLKELSRNNDLILITARSDKEALKQQIRELCIEDFFTEIFVVSPSKNTIEEKSEILKKSNVNYMVGDTEVDKSACELAGIDFKFMDYGFRNDFFPKMS